MKMNLWVFKMKMGIYESANSENSIMMVAEASIAGANPDEMEHNIRQSMQDQGKGNEIRIEKAEQRELVVQGENKSFLFAEGTDLNTDKKFYQVSGDFRGKKGTGFLIFQMEEDDYDEEQIIKIIESVK